MRRRWSIWYNTRLSRQSGKFARTQKFYNEHKFPTGQTWWVWILAFGWSGYVISNRRQYFELFLKDLGSCIRHPILFARDLTTQHTILTDFQRIIFCSCMDDKIRGTIAARKDCLFHKHREVMASVSQYTD